MPVETKKKNIVNNYGVYTLAFPILNIESNLYYRTGREWAIV